MFASARVPSVEERLRVCLTLAKGLYVLNDLVAEHPYVQTESFTPDEFVYQLPQLTRALRDQIRAIHDALPLECMNRIAPLRLREPQTAPPPASIDPQCQADRGER